MKDFDFNNIEDLKAEEKRLHDEYKAKLAELKKVQKEKEAVGQVFTKGLLPIYVLYILKSGPLTEMKFQLRFLKKLMAYGHLVQVEYILY